MKTRLRTTLSLILLVAVGATPIGCTRSATTSGPTERHSYTIPHVLRYATGNDIGGLNPFFTQFLPVGFMSSLTMAWLFRYDAQNRPVPELAMELPTQANKGISADGLSITYHLRKGVVWSDGAPFDARDIVFSWKQVMNPANNITSRRGWELIKRIETPDPHTAIFRLSNPFSSYVPIFFTSAGANPCILPEHLLKGKHDLNNDPYNALPIGIGPFKYEKWARGSEVDMIANERYWRGKPKLERIVFKLIPDRNTTMTQLQSHEIDLWAASTAAYWDRMHDLPGVTRMKTPSYLFDHLDFNMTRPPVREIAVRRALRMALDRPLLLQKINHGVGTVQESMLGPTHPYANLSIASVPFNVAQANSALDAAGWTRASDGIRAKGGTRLSLVFALPTGGQDTENRVELIRGAWKQIGVELTVQHYAQPLFFAPYAQNGILYNGKFDVTVFAWLANPDADMANLFSSAEIPPNGQNVLHYSNPKMDALLATFQRAYDDGKKKALVGSIMKLAIDDAATIVLDIREDIIGFNSDLKGFHPNASTPFDDFMNVDI